jgi:alkaline phosphatase D
MGYIRVVERRTFLGGGLLAAAALASCGDDQHDPWQGQELADSSDFPDGVLAGSPEPSGIHLVVQLAGLVGAPRLGLEIARDGGFHDVVFRGTVEVPALALDVPLHVLVVDAALTAGTRHFYRWVTRGARSPVGRFVTRRADDDARPLRLGFFSCQGWQAGYFPAHDGLAAESLDLVLCLGDYIYDLTDDTGPADRIDHIGAGGAGFSETLPEYRQKYRLYRSDAALRAMHARHALLAVWDNHELAEDGGHLGTLVPRVLLAQRLENGRRAFWDEMPMLAGPGERPLYRSVRLGALVELYLLDLHTHAEAIGPDASYLGAEQRAWLWGGLAASTARWKLIATSTVMMGLDLSAGNPVNLNQWDGYPGERRALVEHVRAHAITGVVALSGDLHTFLAAPVTTTGRADGEAGLVELSGGAISSQGILDLTPDQGDLASILEDAARGANPHLSYIEMLSRGYGVLEARDDELLVTFRSPASVYDRKSPMRDLARFRVRPGEPRVEVLFADVRE